MRRVGASGIPGRVPTLAASENLDVARNLTTRVAAAQGRAGRDGEFRVRSHENVRTTAGVPGSRLARWNP